MLKLSGIKFDRLHFEKKFDKDGNLLMVSRYDGTSVCINSDSNEVSIDVPITSWMELYYCRTKDSLIISDSLPHGPIDSAPEWISREGLIVNFSNALIGGPFDIAITEQSIQNGWNRLLPGKLTTIQLGASSKKIIVDNLSTRRCDTRGTPRELFFDHIAYLSRVHSENISVEVSGGIDSGLIWTCAHEQKIHSIPLWEEHPYYEFSRENHFRSTLLKSRTHIISAPPFVGIAPFDKIEQIPVHNEPNVNSTSWWQFHNHSKFACQNKSTLLLSGHGGDAIFSHSPYTSTLSSAQSESYNDIGKLLKKSIHKILNDTSEDILKKLNARSIGGKNILWDIRMLSPMWPMMYARNSLLAYESGFLCPDFIYSLKDYWHLFKPTKSSVQKPIAHALFSDLLPNEIWNRPGKVDHAGVIARGMMRNHRIIIFMHKKYSGILESLGFDLKFCTNLIANGMYQKETIRQYSIYASWLIWLAAIGKLRASSILHMEVAAQ